MGILIDEYQYRKLLSELASIRNDMRLLSQQIAAVSAQQTRYLELILARDHIDVYQHNSAVNVRDNAAITARDIVGGDESKKDDILGADVKTSK